MAGECSVIAEIIEQGPRAAEPGNCARAVDTGVGLVIRSAAWPWSRMNASIGTRRGRCQRCDRRAGCRGRGGAIELADLTRMTDCSRGSRRPKTRGLSHHEPPPRAAIEGVGADAALRDRYARRRAARISGADGCGDCRSPRTRRIAVTRRHQRSSCTRGER